MKKILAEISEDEKDLIVGLMALQGTYITLLKIKKYSLDKSIIKDSLAECNKKIESFWDEIMFKYDIPLYLDYPMNVDSEKNFIYVKI